MKFPKLLLAYTILAVMLFVEWPDEHKTVMADGPSGPIRCSVIFPYACSDGTLDTGFSIAGDSTQLGDGETPYVEIHYYNSDGTYYDYYICTGEVSENTQWVWQLSSEGITSFSGYLVVLTNIEHVEAASAITDFGGTGAACDAPAIIDYSITGIDQQGRIVRNEEFTPPDEWWTKDPAAGEIDPSLHHTTLIFPVVVTDPSSYKTMIVIRDTSDAADENAPDATVHFFLYDKEGQTMSFPPEDLGDGIFDISEIAYAGFSGSGPGWLIACVNRPHSYGFSIIDYIGSGVNGAAGAVVDNNIYSPDGGSWNRLSNPSLDHTSIIFPYIKADHISNGCELPYNCIFVANTTDQMAEVRFYLYTYSGHLAASTDPLPITSFSMAANSLTGIFGETTVQCFINTYDGKGWVLAVVDTPEAQGFYVHQDPGYNTMSAMRAIVDNDITGVLLEAEHYGEIIRENPVPIESGGIWTMPYVQHRNEYWCEMTAVTINTRNRSEMAGDTTFEYEAWVWTYEDPEVLLHLTSCVEVEPEPGTPSPVLLPSQKQNLLELTGSGGSWGGDYFGRGTVSTNTADAHGALLYTFGPNSDTILISGAAPALIANKRAINGDFSHPVIPAKGGTKVIEDVTVDEDLEIKIVILDADKAGASMLVEEVVEGGDDITIDPVGGWIPLEKDKKYGITLTSDDTEPDPEDEDRDEWSEVLVKENVQVQVRVKGKIEANETRKFTVFWVVVDSPDEYHDNDKGNLPAQPENPESYAEWKNLRDYVNLFTGKETGGRIFTANGSFTAILVRGKILPDNMDPKMFWENYSDDKGFNFKRTRWTRVYLNGNLYETGEGVNGDNLDDSGEEENADSDLSPAKDFGGDTHLYVYHADAPGMTLFQAPKPGDVVRYRSKFREWLLYNKERCSDDFDWFSRYSYFQGAGQGAGNWAPDHTHDNKDGQGNPIENDELGDNEVGPGTTNLTETLAAGNPPPFYITSVSPKYRVISAQGNTGKVTVTVKLGGTPPAGNPSFQVEATSAGAKAITITQSSETRVDGSTVSAEFDMTQLSAGDRAYYRIKVTIGGTTVVYYAFTAYDQFAGWWGDRNFLDNNRIIRVKFIGLDTNVKPCGQVSAPSSITKSEGTANLEAKGCIVKVEGYEGLYYQDFIIKGGGTARFACTGEGVTDFYPPQYKPMITIEDPPEE